MQGAHAAFALPKWLRSAERTDLTLHTIQSSSSSSKSHSGKDSGRNGNSAQESCTIAMGDGKGMRNAAIQPCTTQPASLLTNAESKPQHAPRYHLVKSKYKSEGDEIRFSFEECNVKQIPLTGENYPMFEANFRTIPQVQLINPHRAQPVRLAGWVGVRDLVGPTFF